MFAIRNLRRGKLDESVVRVMRIEIDDDQTRLVPSGDCLLKQSNWSFVMLWNRDCDRSGRPHSLDGSIYKRDKLRQAVRLLQVPMMDFVLLRIEVLLAARTHRFVDKLLEHRTIDSVIRA